MKRVIVLLQFVFLVCSVSAGPIHDAVMNGNLAGVQAELDKGVDVNAKDHNGETPLDVAEAETADLLRKHGGKTGEELEAEGK